MCGRNGGGQISYFGGLMQIVNAKINGTMLGIEDHGIMTASVELDYGGSGQGFGGCALDEPIKDASGKFLRRQGTAYGCEFIKRILWVVGVERWEALIGKHVRVKREDGWGGMAFAIGHII